MKLKNLNEPQRKVYDACRNGWFTGGDYRAIFDGRERRFFADSPRWLYREVASWLNTCEPVRENPSLLVKFSA